VRVLITGGRGYANAARLTEALDTVHSATPVALLIHGDCRGADRLAARWAEQRGIATDPHPADWGDIDAPGAVVRWNPRSRKFYNAAAGRQRNLSMISSTHPELVVAFAGGPGTAHCVASALKAGIPVLSVDD
jgi:hypothetical protein